VEEAVIGVAAVTAEEVAAEAAEAEEAVTVAVGGDAVEPEVAKA